MPCPGGGPDRIMPNCSCTGIGNFEDLSWEIGGNTPLIGYFANISFENWSVLEFRGNCFNHLVHREVEGCGIYAQNTYLLYAVGNNIGITTGCNENKSMLVFRGNSPIHLVRLEPDACSFTYELLYKFGKILFEFLS